MVSFKDVPTGDGAGLLHLGGVVSPEEDSLEGVASLVERGVASLEGVVVKPGGVASLGVETGGVVSLEGVVVTPGGMASLGVKTGGVVSLGGAVVKSGGVAPLGEETGDMACKGFLGGEGVHFSTALSPPNFLTGVKER